MGTLGAVGVFFFVILLVAVTLAVSALAGASVANARGFQPQIGVRFGLVLGPLGVLGVLLVPGRFLDEGSRASRTGKDDATIGPSLHSSRDDPYA